MSSSKLIREASPLEGSPQSVHLAPVPSVLSPLTDLLDLGRRGQGCELEKRAQAARRDAGWNAAVALELACAWLLAGDPRQADLAYLEADQLDPSLALVPDVWGLWPAPSAPADSPQRQAARHLAERWRAWRQPGAQALWQQILPRLQADWHLALDPEGSDALLILGRASAAAGAAPLDPPLETELAWLVADAEIAAEPAASCRYWQLLATIRPQWGLARIRAADLALARGDLENSRRCLADPPAEVLTNPWFHDVAARHAVQRGAVDDALDAWAEAIRTATSSATSNDHASDDLGGLAEIFELRRREARRGPGVLQVRSLVNRGQPDAASALLKRLLADDPQWQPLRSLQEQLRRASPGPTPSNQEPPSRLPDPHQSEGLSRLLDRATVRLQALGQAIPPPRTAADTEASCLQIELETIALCLSDYEARFALA